MSSVQLLVWGLAIAATLLVLVAGLEHTRRRSWLRAVLAAQRVLPGRLRPAVVALLGPAEILLALALLGGLLLRVAPVVQLACLAQSLLYLAFAAHTAVVLRRSPGAPCGCGGGDEPASWLVVVRGLVLGVASLVALAVAPPATLPWVGVTTMAGALLGAVAWLSPRLARH